MKKIEIISLLLAVMLILLVVSVQAHDFSLETDGAVSHKVIVKPGILNPQTPGLDLLADYGAYQLFAVTEAKMRQWQQSQAADFVAVDEMDVITLNGRSFDTRRDSLPLFEQAASSSDSGALQIVQFVGPIQDDWLAAVQETGGQPIHYVANNAYLVWSDVAGRSALNGLLEQAAFIQFSAPLPAALKVSPALAEREMAGEKTAVLPVIIQMVRHGGQTDTEAILADLMVTQTSPWQPIMNFQTMVGTLRAEDITAVAALPDVFWIGLQQPRQLMDEVQGQILAGSIITTSPYSAIPTGPGYLDKLESVGFSQNPADYPLVDITDDGIGNGIAADAGGDVTFRESGLGVNPSRVNYITNCTNAPGGQGSGGHGHLNLSIAGGFDVRQGFPYRDGDGYQLGLGINPYGRFGGTRVFNENNAWDTSGCGDTDTNLIKQNQDSGAQISSNSWGCDACAGEYDASSQAYDMGVRDADLSEPGNQQIVYLFSAGNGSNAGSIGTPGNGKNMITIGASENYRPYDVDGCYKGPMQADDVMDMASFSSRGPAPGNRVKPDLVAPGTHVQGTAATTPTFTGDNICGSIGSSYFPNGQTTFTWSSGTSHSAPAVAGLASLYYYHLENRFHLVDPSPALIKAYLTAHPLYLTGYRANDTLPSNSQGYGMPDMSLGLDDTPRVLLDQSVVFGHSGEQWTQTIYVADPTKPVRIVMAYTDQPGAVGTAPQVNDLDLLIETGGETYFGNHMTRQWSVTGGSADRANNMEAVFLPAGIAQTIEMTVTAFNVAGDGVPGNGDATDQDFALVCYNCLDADFGLMISPPSLAVCSMDEVVYTVQVSSKADFVGEIALSVYDLPEGGTAVFDANPIYPPAAVTMTIENLAGSPAGSYPFTVFGTNNAITQTDSATLTLFTLTPSAPALLTPPDEAEKQPVAVQLIWEEVEQGIYTVEIATDEGFTQIIEQASDLVMAQYQPHNLIPNGTYYWRVRAENVCGTSAFSQVFSFATAEDVRVFLPVITND